MTVNLLRRAAWTVAGLSAVVGCVYLQDTFPDLDPGDVAGVVIGVPPGKTGVEALSGASVWIRGSSVRRTTGRDGRFTLRKLPQGDHVVMMAWDANGDRFPDLVKVMQVPIHLVSGHGELPKVDLGRVELLAPSTITGRLVGAAGAACVNVATMDVYIDGTEVHARPGADGRFQLAGLGEYTWTVAAVGGGAGARQDVAVARGETHDMGDLVVTCATGAGSFRLEFFAPEGSDSGDSGVIFQPLLPPPSATACNRAGVCFDRTPGAGGFLFDNVPFDAYALDINLGEEFQIQHYLFVVVADAEPQLIRLMVSPLPGGEAPLDLDGDGAPEMPVPPPENCFGPCREALRTDPLATCSSYDCDDDGDGQSDLDELGGGGVGPCRCGIGSAGVDGGPSCTRDGFRSDLDFNGICDIFERPAAGSSSSGGGSFKDELLLGTALDATQFGLVGAGTSFSRTMTARIWFRAESVADSAGRSGRIHIDETSTAPPTPYFEQNYTFAQSYGHIWLSSFQSPVPGSYVVRAVYVTDGGVETPIASSPLTMTQ